MIRRICLVESVDESEEHTSLRLYLSDLKDPIKMLNDEEFFSRYRFSKDAVPQLFEIVKTDSELKCRSHAFPGIFQLLFCLRFFATGHFQKTDGDLIGASHQTAGRIIHRVSRCIVKKEKFPHVSTAIGSHKI